MTNAKQNNKVNVTVGGAKFVTVGGAKMQDITLTHTETKAFAYNTKSRVEFLGKFEAVIETRKRISVEKVKRAITELEN